MQLIDILNLILAMKISLIKNALNTQGMTQKELADKLEISVTAIQKWFNGQTKPTIRRYKKTLKILNIVDPEYSDITSNNQYSNNVHILGSGNENSNVITGGNGSIGDIATNKDNCIHIPILNEYDIKTYISESSSVTPIKLEPISPKDNMAKIFGLTVNGSSEMIYESKNNKLSEIYKKFSLCGGDTIVVNNNIKINVNSMIGKLVLAHKDNEIIIRLLHNDPEKQLCLIPLNPDYQNDINIKNVHDYEILGNVIKIIRNV